MCLYKFYRKLTADQIVFAAAPLGMPPILGSSSMEGVPEELGATTGAASLRPSTQVNIQANTNRPLLRSSTSFTSKLHDAHAADIDISLFMVVLAAQFS